MTFFALRIHSALYSASITCISFLSRLSSSVSEGPSSLSNVPSLVFQKASSHLFQRFLLLVSKGLLTSVSKVPFICFERPPHICFKILFRSVSKTSARIFQRWLSLPCPGDSLQWPRSLRHFFFPPISFFALQLLSFPTAKKTLPAALKHCLSGGMHSTS